MEQKKNLCAQIPIALHNRVRAEQTESGKSLNDYITEILTSYYEGGTNMASRTLAIQISEELFEKLKAHIAAESQYNSPVISDHHSKKYREHGKIQ